MLRSDINRMIEEAMREFEKKGLILPAWAYWDVKEWYKNPGLGNEIRKDGLGWRVSDFGLGDFDSYGGVFFTMSNSQVEAGSKESIDQLHSLKYIYRRNGQGAPPHFHWSKREEYLNLGEGITTVAVYNKTDKNMIDYYSPIRIKINHVWAEISAGEPQRIPPGSSVYIPDRIIHSYSAEGNSTVAMEIASRNNDDTDNYWDVTEDNKSGTYTQTEENIIVPCDRTAVAIFPQLNELPGSETFDILTLLYSPYIPRSLANYKKSS
ncbi:TPA: D-lyxose/D-mannose family sugar isomerase [Candidatus Woesearchaeota archaeon]|nr:hypothetical protein QT06_C0001G0485 [archaeon GW2011_AR15]MBS3103796.1 D-lyxose/D-mannose family sugar isomerase [Candidatus Woesearchaeota archaeon]HIH41459.1 D-lyxose/D-mannose family sugar isomerase [Candidatus Woesearchaeota archaeon]